MTGRFEGKGVVVTGAAQGIGRAVAMAFAAEGAGVVLVDNEVDVLATTVESIRAAGGRVESASGDVSRREDVKRAVDLAVKKFGHLDAAVQVAGIADFVPFLEFTDASWDRILNVNLRGAWYLAQEAARAMVRDSIKGAIVLTASTNAFQPEAGGLAYNTSKAGVVAVMQTAPWSYHGWASASTRSRPGSSTPGCRRSSSTIQSNRRCSWTGFRSGGSPSPRRWRDRSCGCAPTTPPIFPGT